MKQIVCLIVLLSSFSYGQFTFYEPYQLQITSDVPYESLQTEIDQMRLSFEAQTWPVEVLKYTLYRLRQNPYLVSTFFIQLTIIHPDQSKKLLIPVPINERYIKAFRTEEGFNESYYDFLSDTYEWILDRL